MRTDYHTHTERGPYTVEWLEEFLKTARARGVEEYGVSEHGYRFMQTKHLFDNDWTEERRQQDLDEYMRMIMDARKAGFNVKFGIELDYVPGRDADMREFIKSYPFDYVIGSVHWIGDFGFDLPQFLTRWDEWDLKDVYNRYFEILMMMADSRLFDISGHPDVIKVMGHEPDDAKFLQGWYDRVAANYARTGLVAEVSTAGLRKPVEKMYPAPSFLQTFRAHGVPISLSSDAHRPEDVGADYDTAVAYIREAGYDQIATFTKRDRTMVPLT
jgi:histidinol-phosphatase (PHP family)